MEDEPALLGGMVALVTSAGHAAHGAASLADARRQLMTLTATHLILDLNLPDGLSTELLRELRRQGISARVMFLTGSADRRPLAEAGDLGIDLVVTKPPDWDKLLAWVGGDETGGQSSGGGPRKW